jgi:hypothetical protein
MGAANTGPASTDAARPRYRSIFSPATARERTSNFEDYWVYTRNKDGEILEAERDLTEKREILRRFQGDAVRSRAPLADPARFYRNCVAMRDDPATLDRRTLLLTFLYKFARHEWVGISGAWDATPLMAEAKGTIEKISRYHLTEEFCHLRLFEEMFRTLHVDAVEWVPLSKWMQRVYDVVPRFPGTILAPVAFVSELMGLTVYLHIDRILDDVLADEPEARERIRELLREIMADELAHVGQRRNFLGPVGLRAAQAIVRPMYRLFFSDIPEASVLFRVDQMTEDGRGFDYGIVPSEIVRKSWVPSYCQG